MYIEKHAKGYRCHVQKNGVRKSAVWATKRDAQEWGRLVEAELSAPAPEAKNSHTLGEAVARYADSVSVTKAGERWERFRLNVMLEHFGDVPLSQIDTPQIAGWRDARLKQVTGSTVVREINLLRNLFNIARKEWKWVEHYPFGGVKLPRENEHRHQVWGWKLIKRVLRAERTGKTAEMQAAFHIALRSGMRLAEVLKAPEHFDAARRVVTIKTKTEARAQIPIGRIAAKLLQRQPFVVEPNEGSTLFSKLCKELLIEGLTFHDTRATALTHLARKVDVMVLSRISRHKDLKILMAHYYRATPESIAARI